ncbi:hypothetical protein A9W93_14065 [Mycobacterium colombiense]|nr:hypothetical protein A9W93_14065 [Mycobacterium colombiense]
MSSRYWVEPDTCEVCDGLAEVYMKQDFANGGFPLRPIVQRVKCVRGCLGQVMSPQRVMNRGA